MAMLESKIESAALPSFCTGFQAYKEKLSTLKKADLWVKALHKWRVEGLKEFCTTDVEVLLQSLIYSLI